MYRFLLIATILFVVGCTESNTGNEPPPIEMGNPATIVTETDSQYLKDVVPDLNFGAARPATIATTKVKNDVAKNAVDTQQTTAQSAPVAEPVGKGLKVPFPQVTFFIPNIDTRTYKEPNLEVDYGASYELATGSLHGNTITIAAKEITSVSMRYQTIVVARDKMGTLPLESLRKLTDWEKIKGKNGVYKIEGLEAGKLKGLSVSNNAIRKAVRRDARNRNWSNASINSWLKLVRNTRNTSQKPLSVELRSVMWKVSGKDKNGRPFTRQLRIDVPIKP